MNSARPARRLLRCLPALCALAMAAGWWAVLQNREEAGVLPAAAAVPGQPERMKDLIRRVEQQRGIAFRPGLQVLPATAAEIQQRHVEDVKTAGAAASERRKAWEAMGFRWEPDWPVEEALAGLAAARTGKHFDAAANVLRVEDAEFPHVRPASRPRLTLAVSSALVQQHRQPAALFAGGNEDEALAQAALVEAEAGRVALRCELNAAPAPPETRPDVYATPRFLRELLAFPATAAASLGSRLEASGAAFAGFDAAWQTRRFSTAALLEDTAGTVEHLPTVPDKARLSGTVGLFGIRTLLKSQLTKEEALRGSTGWRGDRYAFDGTTLIWISRWQEDATAAAFARSLADVLLLAKGLPPESLHTSGSLRQCVTERWSFRICQDAGTVTLWSTPQSAALPTASLTASAHPSHPKQ